MPGEGIEPTLLSKLDFESDALTISLKNQWTTSVESNFARSLQNCPWSSAILKGIRGRVEK